eukprot:SAG22_NODE_11833_length_467_cov_0.972826_1_plen_109_part_01
MEKRAASCSMAASCSLSCSSDSALRRLQGFVVFCRGYGSEHKAAAEALSVLQPLLPESAPSMQAVQVVGHRGVAVLTAARSVGGASWRPSAGLAALCAGLTDKLNGTYR